MAMKQTGLKVYKTMQGKSLDMDLLRQKNELTPAVGNARVNARGDELGPGGKIIKKRDEILDEYYRDNSKFFPDESPIVVLNPNEETTSPNSVVEAKEEVVETSLDAEMNAIDKEAEETGTEWVEDADGNFVKKK